MHIRYCKVVMGAIDRVVESAFKKLVGKGVKIEDFLALYIQVRCRDY